MHPSVHARTQPDKPAVIMAGSGETLSYGELDRASNRAAHHFRAHGIGHDGAIALCLENSPRFLEIMIGALRAGIYAVPVPSRLTAEEVEYIVRDSGAALLIASRRIAADPADLAARLEGIALGMTGDPAPGFASWDAMVAAQPDAPIADELAGSPMLYSSGTTGRPKGIRLPLPDDRSILTTNQLVVTMKAAFGFSADSVYLVPAPLYHAAPLHYSLSMLRIGGTIVAMEKFDPEAALAAIERYRITHAQFVPTHFVRMLKLPAAARARYDLSSLRFAIHAAAPCPVPVKQAMIDWWGPIIMEYYAGSEGCGTTIIGSADWLAHPGSVGRPVGCAVHICGDDGEDLPVGETGLVYFEGPNEFRYHNDPGKTAEARNACGWATLGDIGRLDAEGFLYLTDRKSFMIISGGVNIYPQEIENLLITHPRVMDAAVIGAPDAEMGEKVVAVVQPVNWKDATPEFAVELEAWLREHLSGVKIPRRIDFREELPREPTGKLLKRLLRDEYWKAVR
ncbi:MAG: acyl-CoA synthetase [Sphingomonadaceae bacterium]|nr:acyl-CoA synthetase [Sphingomonadaceae bacterium]